MASHSHDFSQSHAPKAKVVEGSSRVLYPKKADPTTSSSSKTKSEDLGLPGDVPRSRSHKFDLNEEVLRNLLSVSDDKFVETLEKEALTLCTTIHEMKEMMARMAPWRGGHDVNCKDNRSKAR
jgi:hypothetical protein